MIDAYKLGKSLFKLRSIERWTENLLNRRYYASFIFFWRARFNITASKCDEAYYGIIRLAWMVIECLPCRAIGKYPDCFAQSELLLHGRSLSITTLHL